MKCAVYSRVSTQREEQKNSLHNQIVLAESIAKDNELMIVAKYTDSISGAGFKNREGIQQLLKDAKVKRFDTVIAKSVSRLGRNMLQSLQIADELERLQIRLILPEDAYDTKTSSTRLMFNLKAALAEEEAAKLSERVKLGLQASAKEGKVKCSLPPYGYKINPISRSLEIHEEYAPIVKDIFDYYLHKGWGMSKIGNHLMRLKVATPRSVAGASNAGFRWHQQTIKTILSNPTYTGKLVQHRSESTKYLGKSETYKLRRSVDADRQIIVENTHPAIISQEDFETVQALMKSKRRAKSNGRESLFANIAVCTDCGCGMHFKAERRNGAYVCGGYIKHSSSFCTSHIIEEKKLLAHLKKDITALTENDNIEFLYGVAEKRALTIQKTIQSKIKSLEKQSEKLNQQFNSLLSLHAEAIITSKQFKEKNQSLSEQQLVLANRKLELQSQLDKKEDRDKHIQAFKKIISSYLNLDINNHQKMKQVLRQLIIKIEVSEKEEIVIHYNLAP
ncbi:recombinase family protein [Neobacillus niacini]|uniref:recombinase family protein n=1 Tax=Neobacillus niacini TaxID=86668 RepID=UPI0007AB5530|nr:recombinase family protein [Neobacillus niacini]MEC1524364.1 recombinase family protein [Neobacillus niacini]